MVLLSTLLLLGVVGIKADQITPRYNSGCELFLNDTRIYCFAGGYSKTPNVNIASNSDQYYIDVSVDFTVSSAQNNWVKITPPANFAVEATFSYVGVKISDNTYLMNGGVGTNDAKTYMKNQTTTWRVDANEWTSISNTSGIPQSYYSTGVLLPNSSVAFLGGISAIGSMTPTVKDIATLQIAQTSFWNARINSSPPGNPLYSHTATLDRAGASIYYIGGRNIVYDSSQSLYTYPYVSMGSILVFHTVSSTWETKNVAGSVIPASRTSHTANLLPNSTKIFIYGGATSNTAGNRTPVSDYSYLYDPESNTYEKVSITNADGTTGAGPRFGHNAVLRNNTLFILFGIDQNQLGTSDFYALDVKNFQWITNYYSNGTIPSSNKGGGEGNGSNNPSSSAGSSSSNEQQPSSNNSGLSSGAIAGTVVGVIAGVAIVGFAAFFFYRRRKQKDNTDQYPTYWDITKEIPPELPAGLQNERMPTNTLNKDDLNAPPASPIVTSPMTEASTVVNDKLWPPDVSEVKRLELVKPDIGKQN